jgi:hypothetical protein
MSALKEQAKTWLHSIVGNHIPSNARRYTSRLYLAQRSIAKDYGFQIDISPMEGKIVEENEEFILMKVGRTEFFVALKSALEFVPEVGSTCRITPYARKRFDGERLDKPVSVDAGDGFIRTSFILGEYRSYLPIDKQAIICKELVDTIEVIENERADEIRTIAQVLIDAGALKEPVFFQDVTAAEEIIAKPPTVRFRVATTKFDGYLSIVYDRAMDSFRILLQDRDLKKWLEERNQFITITGPSALGQKIIELVDDGQWKIAPVEVLKKAPRQRAEAIA